MGDVDTVVNARPAPMERRRLPWREEMITCLLGTWLLTGLYLDGWAHRNINLHDSIATPWHAVLYSGWGATAGWIIYLVLREANQGKRGLAAIPRGYGLGVAGVVSFAVGGAADQVWHLFLGVEQDIQAFLSPTHWLLAIGMGLMVSCSLRAGWTSFDTARPSFRQFAPTLWSITLTTAMISFAYNYLSLFVMDNATIKDSDLYKLFRPEVPQAVKFAFAERLRMQGVGDEIVWTVLLMGISLLVLRRWRPPFGSYTILFGVTTTAVNAVWNFDHRWSIVAGVVGGITADVLVRWLDPRADRPLQFRIFSAVVPTVMWAAYFVTIAIAYGMGWKIPMWAGAVTFAAPVGVLISALIVPMSIPVPSEAQRAGNGLHPNGDGAMAVLEDGEDGQFVATSPAMAGVAAAPSDETAEVHVGVARNGRGKAKAAPVTAARPAEAPPKPTRPRTRRTTTAAAAEPPNRNGSGPAPEAAADGSSADEARARRAPSRRRPAPVQTEAAAASNAPSRAVATPVAADTQSPAPAAGQPATTRARRSQPPRVTAAARERGAIGSPAPDAGEHSSSAPAAAASTARKPRAAAKRSPAAVAETHAAAAPSPASSPNGRVAAPAPAAVRRAPRAPAATGRAGATRAVTPEKLPPARRPRKTPPLRSNGAPSARDLEGTVR
jgi:hypothetical protein